MDLDLGQLRQQAKELVRAARAGDERALARLAAASRSSRGRSRCSRASTATRAGRTSWPRRRRPRTRSSWRRRTGRRARAEALLAARPAIRDDPWARLALGEGWDGDPSAPGGPRGWAPLLYVCHSVFASAALARELLARGADPNATFRNRFGDMSALYGASGVVHDPELTAVLLEAGADPDDGESVYHAACADDPACLRLLLEAGATAAGTNALAAALDEERPEHVALLLDAGADPAEGALLAHAVRRGRSPAVLRLLAGRGADVDRPGGETWRGAVPLRTPYQHAVLRGRDDQAEALAELGASTDVDPADRRLGALARGERPDGPCPTGSTSTARRSWSWPRCAGTSTRCSRRSGLGSAASWAARRRASCSTTPPGSAPRASPAPCWRRAPTRGARRRRARHAARLGGALLPRRRARGRPRRGRRAAGRGGRRGRAGAASTWRGRARWRGGWRRGCPEA